MADIVLSQRIVQESEYRDIPFERYHFPRRYRRAIHRGDRFLYYQGDRWHRDHRYYFGAGVVGDIYPDLEKENHFFADMVEAHPLPEKVPIYAPDGSFYESLSYTEVRRQPMPAWQNSIRPISKEAFETIVYTANATATLEPITEMAEVEGGVDWADVLNRLNERYKRAMPGKQQVVAERYLDRGTAVTRVLKEMLGATCQVCGVSGFETRSGRLYIEAHHLVEVSRLLPNSLCSENVLLVCPTCHKMLHHARFELNAIETTITICIFGRSVTIPRNTTAYLTQRLQVAKQNAAVLV